MRTVGLIFKKKSGNRRTEPEKDQVKNATQESSKEQPEKDEKED